VNAESKQAQAYVKSGYHTYTQKGIDESVVSEIVSTIHGVSFTLKTKQNDYSLSVALLGRHTIGPVCAAVAIAEKLGLTKEQIEDGVAALRPYEHRMSPRQIVEGAWLIDDTYNGNIDGLAAGLHLLAELEAGRKIYVTPGLVDQGPETQSVHERLGTLIVEASPDVVVLMKNSVTDYIVKGMNTAGYSGELRLEDDPLHFYKNIDQFVASGDVVLMQNDWPDNYA
jgi:UDP-N-acetylmuramoyl-tripeptide--D-alanyl-D-alanine ligase